LYLYYNKDVRISIVSRFWVSGIQIPPVFWNFCMVGAVKKVSPLGLQLKEGLFSQLFLSTLIVIFHAYLMSHTQVGR
jgi:hypothetical protein